MRKHFKWTYFGFHLVSWDVSVVNQCCDIDFFPGFPHEK